MTYELENELEDDLYRDRVAILQGRGIVVAPSQELDDLARTVAQALKTPFAMVNLPRENDQFFVGMYAQTSDSPALIQQDAPPDRTMDRFRGGCPLAIQRDRALPVPHLPDYAPLTGNEVIDEFGIKSYLGYRLVDPESGINVGTVCAVDTDVHEWTQGDVDEIKRYGQWANGLLFARARRT